MDNLTVVTTGFVVLDIVEPNQDATPTNLNFGGSAGNVAVILAALRWDAYPLCRLPKADPVFSVMSEDLDRFGVNQDFVSLEPSAPLPMIAQRKRKDGTAKPIYTQRCPRHNQRWRGWSPITDKVAQSLLEKLPRFDCLAVDDLRQFGDYFRETPRCSPPVATQLECRPEPWVEPFV